LDRLFYGAVQCCTVLYSAVFVVKALNEVELNMGIAVGQKRDTVVSPLLRLFHHCYGCFTTITVVSPLLRLFHHYYGCFITITVVSPLLRLFHRYYGCFTTITVVSPLLRLFHHYYCCFPTVNRINVSGYAVDARFSIKNSVFFPRSMFVCFWSFSGGGRRLYPSRVFRVLCLLCGAR